MMRRALWAPLMALVACGVAAVAHSGRPMTPEDLCAITRIDDPQPSPNGEWVAVTVVVPDLAADTLRSDVWLVSLDGASLLRLTHGSANNHSPKWSPDGLRLVFISDRQGTEDLYLITVDGGEARRLTHSETDLDEPVWSPDGRFIVCGKRAVPETARRPEVWTRSELPKCEARTVDRLLFRHWNRWLGDERNRLVVVDVKSGAIEDVTPGDFDTPPVSLASHHDRDIAPAGDELCFVRNEEPDSAASTNHDIWVMDLEFREACRITTNPALDRQPHYSPDGRFIAYVAMDEPGYEADRTVLTLYDRDRRTTRPLTAGLDRSVREIVWSPRGDRLYFTTREEGRAPVYTVDLDGTLRRLLAEGYCTDLAVTADGSRLVFVRSRNHEPPELFTMAADGGEPRRITGFNDELTASLDLPALEELWVAGAGGTRVHAFLQRPPGFDPQQKYPLVLTVHGGPQNMWADRFMTTWFTFPLISAPGYVGLFVNPRGSDGYGSKFTRQVSRDYGGQCIDDLMRAVDHVLATHDFIDPDRLAVVGGSFGGYVVNWINGHSDRFACAVSHAGLYNLTSFFGATEELWFPAWDMGTTPWDEPALYDRWSPHRFAGRMRTPTLVTHGELDFRVPFGESLQLFTALRHQRVPARLVVFPDEGHVISGPQNNVRWWKEIHRWLGEHLDR